jgi:hypothetical protein
MTVPPPVVAANRAQLMSLIATNIPAKTPRRLRPPKPTAAKCGPKTPPPCTATSARRLTAATLSPFTPPQQTTNPAGPTVQAAAVANATATSAANHAHTTISTVPQLISTVPHVLQALTSPVSPTSLTSELPGILGALSGSSPTSALSLLTPYTAAHATTNLGLASTNRTAGPVLNGTRYGVRRVTVGEDEKCGRVRRHGEHDQGPPRNGRLPGVGSVLTVTVADGGDQLAQSRFRTVCYQHDLAPSPART